MPYNAIKIANAFIAKDAQDGGAGLTPMQLIKLVYIAHGWSFVFNNGPLLNETAQAWQYGPVVPSLYAAVSPFRGQPISVALPGDNDPTPLDPRSCELVDAVYDRYKHLSGTQLSALTHQPNTPWSIVWAQAGRNAPIPDPLIEQHYKHRYAEMMQGA